MAQSLKTAEENLLYLGNLSPSITEASLIQAVQPFGAVVKVKLVPGSFFSQAWVSFKCRPSAEAALYSLNQKAMENFSWQAKIECESALTARLFLLNLPKSLKLQNLCRKLKISGLTTFSQLAKEEHSEGFLQFESSSHSEAAFNEIKKSSFQGKSIQVAKFEDLPIDKDFNGIYVKGFPLWFSQLDLKKMFENFFTVRSAAVEEKFGNVSGFVSCCSAEDVFVGVLLADRLTCGSFHWTAETLKVRENQEVSPVWKNQDFHPPSWMTGFSGLQERERNARVEKVFRSDWQRLDYSVLVTNLHLSMNKKKLEDICQEYGPVTFIQMEEIENIKYADRGAILKETICKGSAVVTFQDQFSASKALKGLRNKCIESQRLHVVMFSAKDSQSRYSQNSYFKAKTYSRYSNLALHSSQNFPQAESIHPRAVFKPFNKKQVSNENTSTTLPAGKSETLAHTQSPETTSKQAFGQNLYPKVEQLTNKNLAGKVTGMLLELDDQTLNSLVQSPFQLEEMVRNALQVLRKAWADKPDQLVLLENH